jgi:acyl-CoA synthetase (NDP forming)
VTRDLTALFDPRSVAVVGASNDPAKWGHWLARGALRGADRRSIFLVNRNGGEIFGHHAYRSISDIPEPPELVVVTVPARGFEEAVDGAVAVGAKAIVGITGGLGELGGAAREREQALARRVREAGAVLLGPNCLGVFDADAGVELSSNDFPPGTIGVISQSGNVAIELGLLAQEVGLGFSRFASLGNQADLQAAELVEAFTEHEPTRAIAVYAEDFRDGRAFVEAAHAAYEAGKPVLLLTVGRSEGSARAARSHTGALVSSLAAVDAACRAAGIERVATPAELVDLAQGLLGCPLPRGRRVAVVGDGGGHGALAADLVAEHGLDTPLLSGGLSARLAETLPPTAATGNPVDLAGGGEQDVSSFGRVVDMLLASDEVDAVLLTGYFGGYGQYAPEFEAAEVEAAAAMAAAARRRDLPLIAHTMYWFSAGGRALREGGVPVHRDVASAARTLARLGMRAERLPRGLPALPPPSLERAAAGDYWAARRLLEDGGVPFVEAREVRSLEDARRAAAELGYPLALKAADILHKTDAGGVVLGLEDERALEAAYADVVARLAPSVVSLERMLDVEDGVELIIGARRDKRFGPVALVGFGGVYAELIHDVAVALAPLETAAAEELILSLRGSRLLMGARRRAGLDVAAAARAAAALSRVAAAHPEIAEIEVNPLVVARNGVVALDACAVLSETPDAA